MPVRTNLRRVAIASLALAAACASAPSPRGSDYERRLDLPADVAAAIVAGAVRQHLPFADPVPQAAGAPANVGGDGRFAVVYERRGTGDWVPRASHRLTLAAGRLDQPTAAVQREPLTGDHRLPGWGRAATERVLVQVHGEGRDCAVRAQFPPTIAADLAQALDRAFALALDPSALGVGLAEPNLAELAALRAVAAARHLLVAGEPARAQDHLLRAERLRALAPAPHRQLGELAAQNGDLAQARHSLGEALLRSTDAATRAHLATRVGSLDRPEQDQAARTRASSFDASPAGLAAAAVKLHTARRQRPEPALDYHLASQLHHRHRDATAALACALLAREHAPCAPAVAQTPGPPLRRGLDDFVRRVVLGVDPVAAGTAGEVLTSAPAAAPAR